ncbi:MAG TPA: phospholipase D-like domain-containing protein [Gemmatimonadaceae bacterium]|nr:phospholipase D-like domain-containing protein [Gemmatimonadaceae bacterium]
MRSPRDAVGLRPAVVSTDADRECQWLIDNAAAYDRVVKSITGAKTSIRITQLAFDADCIAYGTGHKPDVSLAGVVAAASRDRNVDVRILMNQTLLLDTVKPLRKWFISHSAKDVNVRGVKRFPQLMHAKMVIVDDDEAFLVGSPFVNGYWDDSSHMPVDSRRPRRELGGRPLHDVSIRLTGNPVNEARAIFDDWWKTANGHCRPGESDSLEPTRPKMRSKRSNAAVQLVSTSPGCAARSGRKEILAACLEGISRAKSLIYVEHQYLSSRPIVKALRDALDRNPDLELVVVLNQNPDITAYRGWQNDRLKTSGLMDHPRVGLFSLWTAEPRSGRLAIASQVFVHSKVLIVDDNWAMAGSANLDGVSLDSYGNDFAGAVARRLFRRVRNFDICAIVRDGTDGVPPNGFVASLRARLWAEHLGMNRGATMLKPASGWLSLWRKRARHNVKALSLNDTRHRFHGFVLPYSVKPSPAKQWADLGIRRQSESPRLAFNPGWVEVYLSPNWIRNMFL